MDAGTQPKIIARLRFCILVIEQSAKFMSNTFKEKFPLSAPARSSS
jgi:hypothetical protein